MQISTIEKQGLCFYCFYNIDDGIIKVVVNGDVLYSEKVGSEEKWVLDSICDLVINQYIQGLELDALAEDLFNEC